MGYSPIGANFWNDEPLASAKFFQIYKFTTLTNEKSHVSGISRKVYMGSYLLSYTRDEYSLYT